MKNKYNFILLLAILCLATFNGSCEKENPITPPDPITPEIGRLESSPDTIEQNTSLDVTFRFTLGSGISLSDSLVRLSTADNTGNPSTQLGILQDNGNLGKNITR